MARSRPAQLRIVGTAFLRRRPLVTLPIALANLGLFAAGGAPGMQLLALAIGFTVLHAMFLAERWLGRHAPLADATLGRSLAVTELVLGVGCAMSGGLASPIVPLLLAPAGIAFAAFGSARASHLVFAELGVIVVGLVLLPAGHPFPVLGSPHRELALALGTCATAILLFLGVGALARAYANAAATLGRAGEDAAWAAVARARALETVGARVAHEVKNPLAAIRGLVEVMIEGRGEDDRDHRRLTVVAGEVARIEEILRNYLDQHKPAAELEPTDVGLEQIMHDVAAVLEVRAERAGVTVAASGPALRVRVDARRLKEAVLNLVLNALDASDRGGRIEVRWTDGRRDGEITIAILDRGRGMTAGELAQLGTPGFTTRAGGSGLGVALARGVIEQHGGSLAFTSTPGQGTTATITLPGGAWPRS